LDAQHDESWIVTTCQTYVVEVVEP
jgi:hypothetical protein